MPRDNAHLEDILEAAKAIRRFTDGVSREEFKLNEEKYEAVNRKFEIIGEAARRLSPEARNLFPEVFANFNLALAEDFTFNVGADVAWQDNVYEKNIYGLSFNRIEESVKNRISQYVEKNFPGELVKQWWKGA